MFKVAFTDLFRCAENSSWWFDIRITPHFDRLFQPISNIIWLDFIRKTKKCTESQIIVNKQDWKYKQFAKGLTFMYLVDN